MLSKAEQKELTELYLKWQKEYNETHDRSILWDHMRPLMIDIISNTVKKLSKNHFVNDIEHRVEMQTDRVIKRYIDNPQYNRDLPLTIGYWESVNLLYGSDHEKLVGNYEHNFEYETASYEEGEQDIKIVEVGGNRLLMNYSDKKFCFLEEGDKVEEVIKALEEQGWKKTV